MTQVSGTVQYLQSKQVTPKQPKFPGQTYTFWTATINGTPVNVGFNQGRDKKPVFNQGMEVTIETEEGYKGELKYIEGSLKLGAVSGSSNSNITPIRASGPSTSSVVSGDREMSIIRQSALKAAVDVINGAGGKATLEERYQQIIDLAAKFAKFSSGQLQVDEAKKMVTDKKKTTKTVVADDGSDIEQEIAANA